MRFVKPCIKPSFGQIAIETAHNADYVEAIKFIIPLRDRTWDPDSKVWIVTKRYYAAAVALVRHFYGEGFIDSVGGVTEAQAMDWEERFEAWKSFGAKKKTYEGRPKMAHADSNSGPYAALYLLPNAPPQLIKAAYRTLAVLYHPDKGGDVELMKRINGAYEKLKQTGVV